MKRYEPTEKFVGVIEAWTNKLLQIVDAISRVIDWPCIIVSIRCSGADAQARHGGDARGWRALEPFPEVSHFIHSDAGWMLLSARNRGIGPVR